MTPAAHADPSSAFAALATRARATRTDMLVGIETLGLLCALAVFIWLPDQLALALPFLALAMFGLWGATEHARRAGRDSLPRSLLGALRAIQLLAAVVGTVAALLSGYAVVGRMIGTVVS